MTRTLVTATQEWRQNLVTGCKALLGMEDGGLLVLIIRQSRLVEVAEWSFIGKKSEMAIGCHSIGYHGEMDAENYENTFLSNYFLYHSKFGDYFR